MIVDRGRRKVIRRLASNTSARFSNSGYRGMIAHAEVDDELTEILGLRIDFPIKFFWDLLRRYQGGTSPAGPICARRATRRNSMCPEKDRQ